MDMILIINLSIIAFWSAYFIKDAYEVRSFNIRIKKITINHKELYDKISPGLNAVFGPPFK
jgi:Cu/Ag efflux protein CusF